MISANANTPLGRLRERWSDPLLTTLGVLLILMMFVFAPLQAIGIKAFQILGFASALVIIGGMFLMSGSPTVVVALLAAFIMAGTAAVSRLGSPSILDVYLAFRRVSHHGNGADRCGCSRGVFSRSRHASSDYRRHPGLSEQRADLCGSLFDCRLGCSQRIFRNVVSKTTRHSPARLSISALSR